MISTITTPLAPTLSSRPSPNSSTNCRRCSTTRATTLSDTYTSLSIIPFLAINQQDINQGNKLRVKCISCRQNPQIIDRFHPSDTKDKCKCLYLNGTSPQEMHTIISKQPLLIIEANPHFYMHSTNQSLIQLCDRHFHQLHLIRILLPISYQLSTFKPMEASKTQEELDKYLQSCLQGQLQGKVDEKYVKQLSQNLFPLSSKSTYFGLFQAVNTFYIIKVAKNIPFEDITKDLIKKCEEIGHGLPQLFKKVFQGEFNQKFKSKFANPKDMKNMLNTVNIKETIKESKEEKKNNDVVVIGSTSKAKEVPKHSNTHSGSTKSASNKHQSKKPPAVSSQLDYVNNLAERGVCLCEKQVIPQEGTFVCIHCGRSYHLECMKKKAGTRHCSFCHLKRVLPNKEVKKVLFLGVLKKSKRKHQFNVYLSEDDLSMKYRLQIRCFRLKDTTQFFMLFPDYTNIVINNNSTKQFQPLHRQSSLKYRKDDPFFVQFKHLIPKENKIVIHQKLPSKQNKEERIDVQNHLIGFFMIEDRKIQPLVKEIADTSITTFEQSKKILQSAFKLGNSNGNDDVTCQVVKIPLQCTLTTDKIKIPARGIFCTHFQCFDLYNYMIITSSTMNPKWICPLCRVPCYQLKVDAIITAILHQYAEQRGTQVMFFKNGQFNVTASDKLIQGKINNINDLPIDDAGKRSPQPTVEPQKKKKKMAFIPENTNVITLD